MIARSARFAVLLLFVCFPALAAGHHVVFVGRQRTDDGAGTRDRPFRKLAQAQASSALGDVIYVAEAVYDEGILLKNGQMLIGSAYGLEAVRADLKAELDAPIVAAVQGPGAAMHGTVTMGRDDALRRL